MIRQAKWSMGLSGILAFTLASPVAWGAEEPQGQEQMQQSASQKQSQPGSSSQREQQTTGAHQQSDAQQIRQELESLPTGKDKEFYRQTLKERNYQITKTTLETEDVLQLEAEKNGQTLALSIGFDPATGQSKKIEAITLAETGQAAAMEQSRQTTPQGEGKTVARVPEVEEELQVGKREVQAGGVRVTKKVEEKPVEKQVQLQQEQIEVERRQVDRPLTQQDKQMLQEGKDTIVVPKVVEKPVVSKEARVVEEVVVKKDQDTRQATVRDTVRQTEVDVEKMNEAQTQTGTTSNPEQQAMTQQSKDSAQPQARNASQQMEQELKALPTGKEKEFYRQTLQEQGYEIVDTKSEQQQMELEVMKDGQTMVVTVQFAQDSDKSTEVSVAPKQEAQVQTSQRDE